MNIVLRVVRRETLSISELVKQMCNYNCRFKVDPAGENIFIDGLEEGKANEVIDLISKDFDVIGVDMSPDDGKFEFEEVTRNAEADTYLQFKYTCPEVYEQIQKLLRSIFWLMRYKGAIPKDVCKHLMDASTEMHMKYNPKEMVEVKVGDVVDCNYGNNIPGEISGGHVHALICNIDDGGMIYAIPIGKASSIADDKSFLHFVAKTDIEYVSPKYTGGVLILKKAQYINPLRVQSIVGHAMPEFFEKVLLAVLTTVDFSGKLASENKGKSVLVPVKKVEKKKSRKDQPTREEFIIEQISDAVATLDRSKEPKAQVDSFMEAIGFSKEDKIIRSAFLASCVVKRVTMDSVLLEVCNSNPNIKEEVINSSLKISFNKWLEDNYPMIKEKYPKISIISLLKVFVKNVI